MIEHDELYYFFFNNPPEKWFEIGRYAIKERNERAFFLLNEFIVDYFVKIVVSRNKKKIDEFSSLITHFISDFYWDTKNIFSQVEKYIIIWNELARILDIIEEGNIDKELALFVKKTKYGKTALQILAENEVIQAKDFSKKLGIESSSNFRNRMAELEKMGIIYRQRVGKNSFYSLTEIGMNIYEKYFKDEKSLFDSIYRLIEYLLKEKSSYCFNKSKQLVDGIPYLNIEERSMTLKLINENAPNIYHLSELRKILSDNLSNYNSNKSNLNSNSSSDSRTKKIKNNVNNIYEKKRELDSVTKYKKGKGSFFLMRD